MQIRCPKWKAWAGCLRPGTEGKAMTGPVHAQAALATTSSTQMTGNICVARSEPDPSALQDWSTRPDWQCALATTATALMLTAESMRVFICMLMSNNTHRSRHAKCDMQISGRRVAAYAPRGQCPTASPPTPRSLSHVGAPTSPHLRGH